MAPSARLPRDAKPGSPNAHEKPDHDILYQSYFKSVGPRTYAAQVKMATNGNHYLVLTEGRRDKQSGEIRKMRLNVFSEDFESFFNLLRDAAQFIKANPLPPEFVEERKKFWSNTGKRRGKPGAFAGKRKGDRR